MDADRISCALAIDENLCRYMLNFSRIFMFLEAAGVKFLKAHEIITKISTLPNIYG